MPRLSLYRPEKAHDYAFMDRTILEQFMVGGTDIYVHKYLGPADINPEDASPAQPVQSNAIPELGIQDLLLLENRDRKYSDDIYVMRCIYNMQQLDWSLTQFGLFLANDTIFVHVHLNDSVKRIGRKLMPGDVLELPHLKDPYALNDATIALRRFYVVDDVLRPTEGFSQTWYPHLLKLKCKPLTAGQEFNDILDKSAADPLSPYESDDNETSLRDLMTSYNTNMQINQQVIAQAEADAPLSGYSTETLWMVPVDANGRIMIADDTTSAAAGYDASDFYVKVNGVFIDKDGNEITNPTIERLEQFGVPVIDTSIILKSPRQNYYLGYMVGDSAPPNGYALNGMGVQFPDNAVEGGFFLRTDFVPSRLFRYDGRKWVVFEDNVRMTMTNNSNRQTLKTSFINNNRKTVIHDREIAEKQPLSKPLEIGKNLKPQADN